MDITQKITLDLDRRSVYTTICAKQGDTKSRKAQITLVSGGAVYKAPSGAQAKFRAQKPDGTIVLNPAVVNSDGTVTVELTRQTLAVAGSVTADVYLTDSAGAVLSSASFVIHVEPAPAGVQTDSENEFLHLVALVEQAESASTTAGKQAQAAAASAQQAQDAERSATQIVQAATNHAGRRDNPHGVTAAQIGAAPAGYGLGGDAALVPSGANLDTYTSSGFYRWGTGTTQVPFEAGTMIVVKRAETYVHQLAFRSDAKLTEIAVRTMTEGVFDEWEWINPPIQPGVEYRTTERYMGRPVFTQLVDFGMLPQTAQASVKIPNPQEGAGVTLAPIRAELLVGGDARNQGTAAGYKYPFVSEFYTNASQIIIKTTANDAAYARVQVWYTKH